MFILAPHFSAFRCFCQRIPTSPCHECLPARRYLRGHARAAAPVPVAHARGHGVHGARADAQRGARADVRGPADRKSTRLNSSHSQISYAVFCLKKKKKKTYETIPPTTPRATQCDVTATRSPI